MAVITYGSSAFAGNAKTRRHERRRAAAIERDNIGNIIDTVFGISAPEASQEPGITGCKNRVEQALRAPNWREPKEESGGSCLPQVALYAAGNRTVRKDAVHIIK